MFFEWLRGIGNAISTFWNELDCSGCRNVLDVDLSNQMVSEVNVGNDNDNDSNDNNRYHYNNNKVNLKHDYNYENYVNLKLNLKPKIGGQIVIDRQNNYDYNYNHYNNYKKKENYVPYKDHCQYKDIGANEKYVRFFENRQEKKFFLNSSKYYGNDKVYTEYVNQPELRLSSDYTSDLEGTKRMLNQFCELYRIESDNIKNIDLDDFLLLRAYSSKNPTMLTVLSAIFMAKVNGNVERKRITTHPRAIIDFAERLGVGLGEVREIDPKPRNYFIYYDKTKYDLNNSKIKPLDLNINNSQIGNSQIG